MISKELAKKVRYIQVMTNKAVNDVLAGEYHSVFKGQGMEFDEVREYQPGDEIRSIDWNVTARTGHPYVKRYREERELTLLFLVDLSASGRFGSVKNIKNEVATELCALLDLLRQSRTTTRSGLVVGLPTGVELVYPDRPRARRTCCGLSARSWPSSPNTRAPISRRRSTMPREYCTGAV